MRKYIVIHILGLIALICSCSDEQEHVAASINDSDSLAFMTATGVSTLISDSGVTRYKLVAEDWQIHNSTSPATWKFLHGFFMERFDENMHTDLFVQADTAYLHTQNMWELRGRVIIKNLQGTLFRTEELFWDMDAHKMWNHKPMDIYMPDRELHGTEFRSNEQMTDYSVTNSVGAFPASDTESESPTPDPQVTTTTPPPPVNTPAEDKAETAKGKAEVSDTTSAKKP